VSRLDVALRRHAVPAVIVATVKKFGDDRGGQWAALLAYYGFFSLFPLLLVLTTILSFAVQGDPDLQERILSSALAQFPIIGDQIRANLGELRGSVIALVVGVIGALWAGMGVVLTLEDAMDDLWDVPRRDRPDFLHRRLRALVGLAVLGAAALVLAALTAVGTMAGTVGWLRIPALAATVALDAMLFGAAFRYLTVAPIRRRDVLPGAVAAAIGWTALLAIGSWLVARQLDRAEVLYGFFAIVLGLLSWIYLGAQVALLSAELNVVLARRLWPRSLQPPPLTEPDRDVLAAQAEEEAARPEQDVHVHFDRPQTPSPGGSGDRDRPSEASRPRATRLTHRPGG
jgi:YihY family inner membrane protein